MANPKMGKKDLEEMKNMQASLPKGLNAVIAYDATKYIESY